MFALTYDNHGDAQRPTLELCADYTTAETEALSIASAFGSCDIRIWELKAVVVARGLVLPHEEA